MSYIHQFAERRKSYKRLGYIKVYSFYTVEEKRCMTVSFGSAWVLIQKWCINKRDGYVVHEVKLLFCSIIDYLIQLSLPAVLIQQVNIKPILICALFDASITRSRKSTWLITLLHFKAGTFNCDTLIYWWRFDYTVSGVIFVLLNMFIVVKSGTKS